MISFLRPSPTLSVQDTRRSLRLMAWESVASAALLSLGSGGFMAAYALALGANSLQIGILAALPAIAQIARLPAILAVERFRRRKAIGIPVLCAGHLMWIPIGAVPLLIDTPGVEAVIAVIVLLAVREIFPPVWASNWTGWMRDLVPRQILGSYHGRRLAVVTGAVAVISLSGSFFVRWWEGASAPDDAILGYSILLIGGALTFGVASRVAGVEGAGAAHAGGAGVGTLGARGSCGAAAPPQFLAARVVPTRVEPDTEPGDSILRGLYAH